MNGWNTSIWNCVRNHLAEGNAICARSIDGFSNQKILELGCIEPAGNFSDLNYVKWIKIPEFKSSKRCFPKFSRIEMYVHEKLYERKKQNTPHSAHWHSGMKLKWCQLQLYLLLQSFCFGSNFLPLAESARLPKLKLASPHTMASPHRRKPRYDVWYSRYPVSKLLWMVGTHRFEIVWEKLFGRGKCYLCLVNWWFSWAGLYWETSVIITNENKNLSLSEIKSSNRQSTNFSWIEMYGHKKSNEGKK